MALKLREDRREVNLRHGWEADYRNKTPNRREELMSSEEKKNAAKRKWFYHK